MIVALNEFVKRQNKFSGKTYSNELSFDFFARHAEQKIIKRDYRQGYRPEVIIVSLDKKCIALCIPIAGHSDVGAASS